MGEIIGTFSAKGGVGKTTTTINLGIALRQFGQEIILMDDGSNSASLELLLGMENAFKIQPRLRKIRKEFIEENFLTHSSGIKIIPSFLSAQIFKLGEKEVKKILKSLDAYAIFIDFSPGLHERIRKVLKICDSALIVTNPDIPSVTEAMRAKRLAERLGKKIKGVILNRSNSSRYDLTQKEIELGFNLPILGNIPEDDEVKRSFFKREPVICLNPYSKASIGFKKIASKFLGISYEPGRFVWLKRLKYRLVG